MTRAALGELPAAQQAELCAHAAGCAACGEELAAARALVAAMDRSVRAMVGGEPSAAFAARLRARLAGETVRSLWPGRARLMFAGAALAAAVVLAGIFVRSVRQEMRPGAEVAAGIPAVAERGPAALDSGSVAGEVQSGSRTIAARARRHGENGTRSFEVLVPRGQLAAALELSEAVNAGRVDGEQLAVLAQQSAMPLELKAIEITPLEDSGAKQTEPAASPDGAGRD